MIYLYQEQVLEKNLYVTKFIYLMHISCLSDLLSNYQENQVCARALQKNEILENTKSGEVPCPLWVVKNYSVHM